MNLIPVQLWTAVTILSVGMTAGAPQRCCIPEQFEAGNGAVVGQVLSSGPEGLNVYQNGGWDLKNRQFGFNQYITYQNGTSFSYRIIQKYAEKSQWIIIDKMKYCVKQPVTYPEPMKCIPDNATFGGTIKIGGPNGTLVDVWAYSFSGEQESIQGNLSLSVVSGGSCDPVGATFIGSVMQGSTVVPMVSTSGIINMTMGIPDPNKWFTVPSFCKSEEIHVSRMPRGIHNVIKLYGTRPLF